MANELVSTENNTQNTAKIESDVQTDAERIKALEAENKKLKAAVTSASADASKHKHSAEELQKKLNEKMTDEERAKEEQAALFAAQQQELETLRKEKNVANYKAELSTIGFESALAQTTAEAINEGDTAKLFEGIRKFIASHDKELQSKALLDNPTLSGGGDTGKTLTKAEFDKMGYMERLELLKKDPDTYHELAK